jgi:hypothetical protein
MIMLAFPHSSSRGGGPTTTEFCHGGCASGPLIILIANQGIKRKSLRFPSAACGRTAGRMHELLTTEPL